MWFPVLQSDTESGNDDAPQTFTFNKQKEKKKHLQTSSIIYRYVEFYFKFLLGHYKKEKVSQITTPMLLLF